MKQLLEESSGFQSYGQVQQYLKSGLGLSIAYKTDLTLEVPRSQASFRLK
ncbi:MAG: hypothetical protein RMZ41_006715 [Nostoc sp. DedVER02]|nr:MULTISPECIES: hypothetical protein [unclassified Nostoc]MDZ7985954.1 hypothetical protein [Nostoc sp. DedVER02]MDZ8111487.1 hypothetical protein [Nostoc sp. DedVER01b]